MPIQNDSHGEVGGGGLNSGKKQTRVTLHLRGSAKKLRRITYTVFATVFARMRRFTAFATVFTLMRCAASFATVFTRAGEHEDVPLVGVQHAQVVRRVRQAPGTRPPRRKRSVRQLPPEDFQASVYERHAQLVRLHLLGQRAELDRRRVACR